MKQLFILTIFLMSAMLSVGQSVMGINGTVLKCYRVTKSSIKGEGLVFPIGSVTHGGGLPYNLEMEPDSGSIITVRKVGFLQDTTCVKDTAEAYLQIQACDSCKVRLRIGFVVADKCSPIGNPETVEYINVSFLDIKRIPLPERATVIKYTRKN